VSIELELIGMRVPNFYIENFGGFFCLVVICW